MSNLEYKLDYPAVSPFKNWDNVDDVGVDLASINTVELFSGKRYLIDTGVSVIPPKGTFAMAVSRSSLAKKNIILINSVGIIDPSYRGNIKANLMYLGPNTSEFIEQGERIIQLLFIPYVNITTLSPTDKNENEWKSSTNRGIGGFGSTGAI